MNTVKVYEYLTTSEWFGSLEKGCRLYYDHDKHGYVYHTEYDSVSKTSKYESKKHSTTDFFISLDIAETHINAEALIPGPVYGELEYKEDKRQLTKKQL